MNTPVALRFGCVLALAALGCTKAMFQDIPDATGQGGAGSGGAGSTGGDGGSTTGVAGTSGGGAGDGGSGGGGSGGGGSGGGVAGSAGGSAGRGGVGGTAGTGGVGGTAGTGGSTGRGGTGGVGGTGVMPTVAGQIVITELMHDVPGSDDDSEWFEIHNPGTVTYDLMGCMVRDVNTPVAINTQLLVPPGAFRTLAISPNVGFTPDFVYGVSIKFDSTAGDRAAITCNGIEIDRFEYSTTDALDTMSVGHTYSVDPRHYSATDNDVRANWCLASTTYMMGASTFYGTPGMTNPQCP